MYVEALLTNLYRCVRLLTMQERGFVLLAASAFLFPPPTQEIASVVLGHLALHRTRPGPVGGLALYTHHHMSNASGDWTVSYVFYPPREGRRAEYTIQRAYFTSLQQSFLA